MTPIKILALIVAVLATIKLLVLLVKPSSWLSVVKTVYARPSLTMILALVLGGIVLNYLLTELTIIQIFAVMSFIMLLMALGVAAYNKEMIELAEKLLKDRDVIKKAWLSITVWIILIIWVFFELFV